ncbi:MAG TPA: HAMP domain-containing sensor histidine kinase [Actinomycetes bacterium]
MVAGRARSSLRLTAYLAAVAAAGLAVLGVLVARDGAGVALRRPAVFWLFAASILAVRLLPAPVRRRHREDRDLAAASGAFALTLALGWGASAGTLALAVGALGAGLVQRSTPLRTAFALGRGTLAVAAADGLYRLLGGGPQLATADLPACVLAAAAFLLVDALAEAGLAVAAGHRRGAVAAPGRGAGTTAPRHRLAALVRRWRWLHGAGPPAWAPLALLAATPVMLVAARHGSLLVSLLLPPTAALWLACRDAAVAEQRRAAAAAAVVASRAAAAEQDRRLDEEEELVRRLEERQRRQAELLATVSHELRTPLTAVLGSLATLTRRGPQLSQAEREAFLEVATRQGERLKRLVEQLLLEVRVEQAAPTADAGSLAEAGELVRQAAWTAQLCHPDREVLVEVAGVLPVRAAADAILAVLGNLVDNAAKYSPRGEPIRLEAAAVGEMVVLAVQDAGPGVPAGEREHIFQRFIQLEAGTANRAGGVGLGLHIARELARAQGGDLVVADAGDGGPGARFELRLPRVGDPPAVVEPPVGQPGRKQAAAVVASP